MNHNATFSRVNPSLVFADNGKIISYLLVSGKIIWLESWKCLSMTVMIPRGDIACFRYIYFTFHTMPDIPLESSGVFFAFCSPCHHSWVQLASITSHRTHQHVVLVPPWRLRRADVNELGREHMFELKKKHTKNFRKFYPIGHLKRSQQVFKHYNRWRSCSFHFARAHGPVSDCSPARLRRSAPSFRVAVAAPRCCHRSPRPPRAAKRGAKNTGLKFVSRFTFSKCLIKFLTNTGNFSWFLSFNWVESCRLFVSPWLVDGEISARGFRCRSQPRWPAFRAGRSFGTSCSICTDSGWRFGTAPLRNKQTNN